MQNRKAHLDDRRLIRVSGDDAGSFLQNVMTNDIRLLKNNGLLYACLLTPQGQVLHDFFVLHDETGGYLLDCDHGRSDDLLRRLHMFRLRAKATLSPVDEMRVYTGAGLDDPRLPQLGKRLYTKKKIGTNASLSDYEDFCIGLGVPCAPAIHWEKDVLADVNLDRLNAVAWDKGCFIGQEVAARMHHRNLAKKRLWIVEGEDLTLGEHAGVGDIRHINAQGSRGLVLVKTAVVKETGPLKMPEYLR